MGNVVDYLQNELWETPIAFEKYDELLRKAEWFSAIQNSDFSNAVLVKYREEDILTYNYDLSSNMATIFITCYNQQLFSVGLEYAITQMLKINNEISELITYLLDVDEEIYLNNNRYKFEKIGCKKRGIVLLDELRELLIYHAKAK